MRCKIDMLNEKGECTFNLNDKCIGYTCVYYKRDRNLSFLNKIRKFLKKVNQMQDENDIEVIKRWLCPICKLKDQCINPSYEKVLDCKKDYFKHLNDIMSHNILGSD